MVNDLHSAMMEGRGKDVLGGTLADLVDYTVTHFATEEAYFDRFGYPGSVEHKAQHQGFVEKVADFKQGFDEDRLMVTLDVMDFLSTWLVEHIKVSDKAYGSFLNQRGVD